MCEPGKNTERGYKMALIPIKDVKQAIRIMMQILEKLDEIYHALHDSVTENEKDIPYPVFYRVSDAKEAVRILEASGN